MVYTSLIEEFHRREKPICPDRLLYIGIFGRQRDEGEDVFSNRVFGGDPRHNTWVNPGLYKATLLDFL